MKAYFNRCKTSPTCVYHYTRRENLDSILIDGKILSGRDAYTFFASSIEHSRLLFRELMTKPVKYIDDELRICTRIEQNPADYVILELNISENEDFYRFNCISEGFNPYEYSILHRGALPFKRCRIIEMMSESTDVMQPDTDSRSLFPDYEQDTKTDRPFLGKLRSCFTKGLSVVATFVMIFAGSTNIAMAADGNAWTDTGNYSTAWYLDSQQSAITLSSNEDLAGLLYFANVAKPPVDFTGKTININSDSDIDLTAHIWQTIPSSFKGTLEGVHKIVTAQEDGPFADDGVLKTGEISYSQVDTLLVEKAGKNLDSSQAFDLAVTYTTAVLGEPGIARVTVDGKLVPDLSVDKDFQDSSTSTEPVESMTKNYTLTLSGDFCRRLKNGSHTFMVELDNSRNESVKFTVTDGQSAASIENSPQTGNAETSLLWGLGLLPFGFYVLQTQRKKHTGYDEI